MANIVYNQKQAVWINSMMANLIHWQSPTPQTTNHEPSHFWMTSLLEHSTLFFNPSAARRRRHTRTRFGANHHVCDHGDDDANYFDDLGAERSTRANDDDDATNLRSEDPSGGGCGGR